MRSRRHVLMIVSDHGFNSFRRGVDLNRWLEENGYLVVDDARRDEGTSGRCRLVAHAGVCHRSERDLSEPVAASSNMASSTPAKKPNGCATRSSSDSAALSIPPNDGEAIKRVYQAAKVYRGPYKDQAPDLIVGYARGYRVSWETAIGRTHAKSFTTTRRPGAATIVSIRRSSPASCSAIARSKRNSSDCWISPRPCSTCSGFRRPTTWTAQRWTIGEPQRTCLRPSAAGKSRRTTSNPQVAG